MLKRIKFLLILFFSIFTSSTILSQSLELESRIEEFIMTNPEVIIKSLQNYERNKEKEKDVGIRKYINDNIDILQKGDGLLFSGNKQSKNIIIEFFDYNCGYCKKSHEEIKQILAEGNDVKVIYMNLPVLSENSMELAKFSLAVGLEDKIKFNKFHDFLLSSKKPIKNNQIMLFLEKLGLNFEEVKKISESQKVKEIINKNISTAQSLHIGGTPAFIINGELVSGFVNKKIMISLLKDN
ncbi:DsbA family protein [Rickettsiales bacterium]|nr:DsbA family protein [Rickettsiales bacterium]